MCMLSLAALNCSDSRMNLFEPHMADSALVLCVCACAQSLAALATFQQNVANMAQVNSGDNNTYWLALNQFSSMSRADMQSNVLMKVNISKSWLSRRPSPPTRLSPSASTGRRRELSASVPAFVNWTAAGRTTAVRALLLTFYFNI